MDEVIPAWAAELYLDPEFIEKRIKEQIEYINSIHVGGALLSQKLSESGKKSQKRSAILRANAYSVLERFMKIKDNYELYESIKRAIEARRAKKEN